MQGLTIKPEERRRVGTAFETALHVVHPVLGHLRDDMLNLDKGNIVSWISSSTPTS